MLLFYELRLAQHLQSARHKDWPRIPGAEWLQRSEVLRQLERQLFWSQFPVAIQTRRQIFFSQTRRRMFIQAPAKLWDAFTPDRQAGRVRMSAEFVQQIAARRQALEQMIGFDAARRAVSHITIQRDHYARSIQPFGD